MASVLLALLLSWPHTLAAQGHTTAYAGFGTVTSGSFRVVTMIGAPIVPKQQAVLQRSVEALRIVEEEPESPPPVATFNLGGNFPNPFSNTTTIPFALPVETDIRITLYDVLGREVRNVVQGRYPAGRHSVSIQATAIPSGLYVYRMEAKGYSDTQYMLLVR